MNQSVNNTAIADKVQRGKLKEWQYVCNDPLRQEAHDALKQEYAAAIEFARSDKLTLEEGHFIKQLGENYCYRFYVSQLIIQAYQADRPHRLEIAGKHIEGSISTAGDGIIEIEIASNFGDILHRIDVIFDLSVLLDLVDRRIVDIDRDFKKWNTNIATELFTNLKFPPQPTLAPRCDHRNRLDNKPLKDDQNSVVNHLLQNQFSLIWGPPGTGKSHTLLAGIAELISNGKTIVFASNTNSAIDNVLEKIIGHNCPYTQLSECRDNGYIVRLGAQSSRKVMDVFSPKAIARLKSEEINQQLIKFQNDRQILNREIELTTQKVHTWEQASKKVHQYNETIRKLKELPPLSELENQTATLEKNRALYTKAHQHFSSVFEKVNRELTLLVDEISKSQKKSKAARALLYKHKNEKINLETELYTVDNQVQLIENSRLKKWFKSKDLEQLKSQSLQLRQKIEQLNRHM